MSISENIGCLVSYLKECSLILSCRNRLQTKKGWKVHIRKLKRVWDVSALNHKKAHRSTDDSTLFSIHHFCSCCCFIFYKVWRDKRCNCAPVLFKSPNIFPSFLELESAIISVIIMFIMSTRSSVFFHWACRNAFWDCFFVRDAASFRIWRHVMWYSSVLFFFCGNRQTFK